MDNLLIALQVVSPVFLLMLLGQVLRRVGLFSADFSKQLNQLVFQVFLPCMLFYNVYSFDIKSAFRGDVILFALGSLVLLFAILWIVVPRVVHDPKQQGVVIQGTFRSNYVIFGVAIVTNMYGAEQAVLASLLSAVLVPTYNFMAVVALEVFTSGGKISVKQTIGKVAQNPLIWATVLGVGCALLPLQFPTAIDSTLADVAKLATPLAFMILGADFEFERLKGNLKMASVVVLCKLVIIPMIFVPIAVMLGYRGADLLAVALAFETPIAVSSYIMAAKAKADSALAGQLVVLSSAVCIFTVFVMIFVLKQLQYL